MNLFIELLLVRYSLNIRYLVKISIFGFLLNPIFSSQYIFKLITYFDNMTEKYFPTLFFLFQSIFYHFIMVKIKINICYLTIILILFLFSLLIIFHIFILWINTVIYYDYIFLLFPITYYRLFNFFSIKFLFFDKIEKKN